MTHLALIVNLLLISNFNSSSLDISNTDGLVGIYEIDLRPTPDAEAYFQKFEISSISEGTIYGTFYGSTIEKGQLNTQWDTIYFAFQTRDSSNVYYHSGRIEGDKVFGITYAPNRKLTAPWSGRKIQ